LILRKKWSAELEGIFQQFTKSVLECALGAEMSHHLGYASGQPGVASPSIGRLAACFGLNMVKVKS